MAQCSWEVGQGRKHNAFRGPFLTAILLFIFEVSQQFCCAGVHLLPLLPSHVPLALSVALCFGHLLVLLFAQALQNSCTSTCQNGPVLPDGFICERSVPCFLMDSLGGCCFPRLDLSGSPGPSRILTCLCWTIRDVLCAALTRCWFARPHRQ